MHIIKFLAYTAFNLIVVFGLLVGMSFSFIGHDMIMGCWYSSHGSLSVAERAADPSYLQSQWWAEHASLMGIASIIVFLIAWKIYAPKIKRWSGLC